MATETASYFQRRTKHKTLILLFKLSYLVGSTSRFVFFITPSKQQIKSGTPLWRGGCKPQSKKSSRWKCSTEKRPGVNEQTSSVSVSLARVSHVCFGDSGADNKPRGAGVRQNETDAPRTDQQGHISRPPPSPPPPFRGGWRFSITETDLFLLPPTSAEASVLPRADRRLFVFFPTWKV